MGLFKKEKIEVPDIPVMVGSIPNGYKMDGIVFALAGPNGTSGYSFEEVHTNLIDNLKSAAFKEGADGVCNVRISENTSHNSGGVTAYGDKMIKI